MYMRHMRMSEPGDMRVVMDSELDQLGERIAEQAAHFDAAMHRLLSDVREFDERGGWHVQGAMSCAHWLAWRVGWDLGTARDRVRVARKLAEFPAIDDALRRGEVSYSKVRAMVRVATPANEPLLLEHARLMTASQLEKLCRKYALVQRHGQDPHPMNDAQRRYVRRRDTEDGMVKIEAVLHPEEAELVWTMLNHAAAQLARPSEAPARDDSAEARLVPAPPVSADTVTMSRSRVEISRGNDSAEARAVAGTPAGTPAATPAATPTAFGAGTGTVSYVPRKTHRNDDSAEARETAWIPATTMPGTGTASSKLCETDRIDDSAEARESAGTPAATPATSGAGTGTVSSVPRKTHRNDDSAEARETAWIPATTMPGIGTASSELCETDRIDDSAEAREAALEHTEVSQHADRSGHTAVSQHTGYARSLIDRLLDEADALREAEGASSGKREASVSEPAPGHGGSVLRQQVDAARRAFDRADALVSLAQGYLRGDRPNRSPIEITVTIPATSLRAVEADPVEVGEMGESFLSTETARRLSCDAGVIEVIEDERGVPLSVGRKRRTIAGALKRALHRRDKTCTFPGCTHRIFLEGHHIQHWADGGETSLMNTALLCGLHHRHVHEYGYTLELDADGRPQFRDPHGRLVSAVSPPPSGTDLGWPRMRAANESLAIDVGTIACGWDGRPIDYGMVIGDLVTADGLL
jgi:hypothetical protein